MRVKFTNSAQIAEYISGDQIACLECEKKFTFLGNHLSRIHGISMDEYRELWGIPAMTPLAGQAYRAMQRDKLQRMQAAGIITYDHLPRATERAVGSIKEKVGVAKIEHANLIQNLRPGDHHKLRARARRADGRDADRARDSQQIRRAGQKHQDQIKYVIDRLVTGKVTPSPEKWICRKLEISPETLSSWMADSGAAIAVTPEPYAIKYLVSILPNIGSQAPRWRSEEDDYLRKHFQSDGAAACAAALNRSLSGTKGRAERLGVTFKIEGHQIPWDDAQDRYLIDYFPVIDVEEIARHLGRTVPSIQFRATKLRLRKLKKAERQAYLDKLDGGK